MSNSIELTRINNDTNGNRRYVVHFSSLINDKDKELAELQAKVKRSLSSISEQYEIAVRKSRAIGGRKYHTKSFGGGIVFQSYNQDSLRKSILEIQAK